MADANPAGDLNSNRESAMTSSNQKVPDRVHPEIALRISPTSLPGSTGLGQGIFIGGNIKEYGLIFSIKKPFLNLIEDNATPVFDNLCDNCFSIGTTSSPELLKCRHCEANIRYCSEACQAAAWLDHHHSECPNYQIIFEDYEREEAQELLRSNSLRFAFRIIQQEASGKIPNEVWSEITSIVANRHGLGPENLSVSRTIAQICKAIIVTTLSVDEIIDLVYKFHINSREMKLPVTKACGRNDPAKLDLLGVYPATVDIGHTFDPFVAQMSHQCDPTAYIVTGAGGELQVRAAKDLVAGDELTLSYVVREEDTLKRKDGLQWHGIECSCGSCQNNFPATLRVSTFRTNLLDRLYPTTLSVGKMERVIKLIEDKYGYTVFPLCKLYDELIKLYLKRGRTADALKMVLKQYYFNKTAGISKSLDIRVNQLSIILSILDKPPQYTSVQSVNKLPNEVDHLGLRPLVYLRLRFQLGEMTAKYYGSESQIAGFENQYFQDLLEHWSIPGEVIAEAWILDLFVDKMNSFLEWAGLPALTQAELLDE